MGRRKMRQIKEIRYYMHRVKAVLAIYKNSNPY